MEIRTGKNPPPGIATIGDPNNEYLGILVAENAKFNSGATGIVTGASYNISYYWSSTPWSSFTTIKIDEVSYVYGSSGIMIQPPTELPDFKNETILQYGNIQVKQTLQIVHNISTGRDDNGMYKYTVTNNDTIAHSVGIRIMIDTMLENNDGAPFRIPNVGAVTSEMEFFNSNIPPYWQAFYSLDNPDIVAQGTLIGGGATIPDRFIIAAWPSIYDNISLWDYTVTPSLPVTGDSAVAIYWNSVVINPGESREFITFYGLTTLSGTADLSITGPTELAVINNEWSPNPFVIIAYITNNTSSMINDVHITLSLPAGLGFAPGETATHIITSIDSGATQQTSWSVIGRLAGSWIYSVTAVNQVVTRKINIPPIKANVYKECSLIISDPVCQLNFCLDAPDPYNPVVDCVYHDICVEEVHIIISCPIARR